MKGRETKMNAAEKQGGGTRGGTFAARVAPYTTRRHFRPSDSASNEEGVRKMQGFERRRGWYAASSADDPVPAQDPGVRKMNGFERRRDWIEEGIATPSSRGWNEGWNLSSPDGTRLCVVFGQAPLLFVVLAPFFENLCCNTRFIVRARNNSVANPPCVSWRSLPSSKICDATRVSLSSVRNNSVPKPLCFW